MEYLKDSEAPPTRPPRPPQLHPPMLPRAPFATASSPTPSAPACCRERRDERKQAQQRSKGSVHMRARRATAAGGLERTRRRLHHPPPATAPPLASWPGGRAVLKGAVQRQRRWSRPKTGVQRRPDDNDDKSARRGSLQAAVGRRAVPGAAN